MGSGTMLDTNTTAGVLPSPATGPPCASAPAPRAPCNRVACAACCVSPAPDSPSRPLAVSPDAFIQLLKACKNLECVYLNGCKTLHPLGAAIQAELPHILIIGWESIAADAAADARLFAALFRRIRSRFRCAIFNNFAITLGKDGALLFDGQQTHQVPATPVKAVDTNGAGDAFCGGFFSGLLQGKSIKDSVNCGHYTAGVVIQRSGCQYADAERYAFP